MAQPMFIWLGSGRTRKRGVGGRGRALDQAARAGLPVPAGAVLTDEFFRFCLERGLTRRMGERLVIPDAELWHNTLFHSVRLPPFARPVAVCSAGRDEAARSGVAMQDPDAAAGAVAAVWTALAQAPDTRLDVIVVEMIAGGASGWAVPAGEEADRITVVAPEAAVLSLPRPAGRRAGPPDLPPFARRLQLLLRGVRRTFGADVLRVQWADDGTVCYLLDVVTPTQQDLTTATAY